MEGSRIPPKVVKQRRPQKTQGHLLSAGARWGLSLEKKGHQVNREQSGGAAVQTARHGGAQAKHRLLLQFGARGSEKTWTGRPGGRAKHLQNKANWDTGEMHRKIPAMSLRRGKTSVRRTIVSPGRSLAGNRLPSHFRCMAACDLAGFPFHLVPSTS